MSIHLYLAFLATCVVMAVIPGPTATLIIANSLRHGTGAGLRNVAGTQLGLAVAILIAGIGLTSIIAVIGHWFDLLAPPGRRLSRLSGVEDVAHARHRSAGASEDW